MILRPKHMRAIELLATTDMTQKEVAKEMRVGWRTICRWVKDRDFHEALELRQSARPESVAAFAMRGMQMLLADMVIRLRTGEHPSIKELIGLFDLLQSVKFEKPEEEI
jgi:hypothetical protein